MPERITPMLATPVEEPFDDPDWLYEVKWDGYRAVAFINKGSMRLVSRNQNDLTHEFPELCDIAELIRSDNVVLDGEVVALDDNGRPSFSLMQQRTGLRGGGKRTSRKKDLPVFYYVFDLIYVDGYDLRRVSLMERKKLLRDVVEDGGRLRFSDHYPGAGLSLFAAARQQGLEGIVAKRATSCYEERRTREWLKIKVTQTVDCVIGGYTNPEGSRQYFGSLVLGLYDKQGRLRHVGNAGTGFTHKSLGEMWKILEPRESKKNPFYGPVEPRNPHWLSPELVAEIKFTEWTHESDLGGVKLRAPVFLRLRDDKKAEECTIAEQKTADS